MNWKPFNVRYDPLYGRTTSQEGPVNDIVSIKGTFNSSKYIRLLNFHLKPIMRRYEQPRICRPTEQCRASIGQSDGLVFSPKFRIIGVTGISSIFECHQKHVILQCRFFRSFFEFSGLFRNPVLHWISDFLWQLRNRMLSALYDHYWRVSSWAHTFVSMNIFTLYIFLMRLGKQ